MKFGLNFFPAFRTSELSTADYFSQALRLCERADELGYSSVKTVEHYFHDYGGHSPNPSILLAAISARTKYMRLVTGAVIPAFNNPIKLAGELAMVDNISQGRLDVGFGRAFIPEEFEAFHIPMDESRARFEEGIEVIKRLWTEDRVTFEGRFHKLHDIHSMPRPIQQPHPPIWVAAVSSEDSFAWAGHKGYNLMIVPFAGGLERTAGFVKTYRQAWREAGHKSGAEQIQMSFHCYLAESDHEAIEGFKGPMTTYLEVFTEAVRGWSALQSVNYPGYDKLVGAISNQTWETNINNRSAFVGTPDNVVETIHYLQELYGEIEPSMQILFGNISSAEALRTIELFAYYVIPQFQNSAQKKGSVTSSVE